MCISAKYNGFQSAPANCAGNRLYIIYCIEWKNANRSGFHFLLRKNNIDLAREAGELHARRMLSASYCEAAQQCFICQGDIFYEAALTCHEALLGLHASSVSSAKRYEALLSQNRPSSHPARLRVHHNRFLKTTGTPLLWSHPSLRSDEKQRHPFGDSGELRRAVFRPS